MMTSKIQPLLIASVLTVGLACDEKAATETPKPSEEVAAAEQLQAAAPAAKEMKEETADEASAPVAGALGEYEKIRVALAKDEVTGVADAAGSVAAAARSAAGEASAATKPHLESMAKAADAVKDKSASIDEARKAFGELSRAVVALLAAEPTLQKGRHVFECPMAPGYEKWVQASAKIENPYMGQKMLECGGESDWGA